MLDEGYKVNRGGRRKRLVKRRKDIDKPFKAPPKSEKVKKKKWQPKSLGRKPKKVSKNSAIFFAIFL